MTTEIIVTLIEGKDGRRDILEVLAPLGYIRSARYARTRYAVISGSHPALHGDIEPDKEGEVVERIFKDDYATWAGGEELRKIMGDVAGK